MEPVGKRRLVEGEREFELGWRKETEDRLWRLGSWERRLGKGGKRPWVKREKEFIGVISKIMACEARIWE